MLGCEPRNFLQPCLLLLLREQPDHGYGLVDRLRPLNAVDGNAGRVYRMLRVLEETGLVRSGWSSSDAGPPRRVYQLTPAGARMLDEWALALEENRRALETYLHRHRAVTAQLPAPDAAGGVPVPRSGAPPARVTLG